MRIELSDPEANGVSATILPALPVRIGHAA